MEFSPDSHDENVRKAMGKNYDNASIEKTLRSAFDNGCQRFDLFYMTGLPEQTRESAIYSASASKRLWEVTGPEAPLFIYNAPFAPFVDPGSRIFEEPEKWGYRLFARTLEEHRVLLDNPSWKQVLSYETVWMDRDAIAEVSYDAAQVLTETDFSIGRIDQEMYDARSERTEMARTLMHRIDDIMRISDLTEREAKLWEVKADGERVMLSTVCNKKDLDWKTGSIWANTPRVISGLLKSAFGRGRR